MYRALLVKANKNSVAFTTRNTKMSPEEITNFIHPDSGKRLANPILVTTSVYEILTKWGVHTNLRINAALEQELKLYCRSSRTFNRTTNLFARDLWAAHRSQYIWDTKFYGNVVVEYEE